MTVIMYNTDEVGKILPTLRRIEQLLDALQDAHSRRCVMTLMIAGWLDRFPLAERGRMMTLLVGSLGDLDERLVQSMLEGDAA